MKQTDINHFRSMMSRGLLSIQDCEAFVAKAEALLKETKSTQNAIIEIAGPTEIIAESFQLRSIRDGRGNLQWSGSVDGYPIGQLTRLDFSIDWEYRRHPRLRMETLIGVMPLQDALPESVLTTFPDEPTL